MTAGELGQLLAEARERVAELGVEREELEVEFHGVVGAVCFDEDEARRLAARGAAAAADEALWQARIDYLTGRTAAAFDSHGLVEVGV